MFSAPLTAEPGPATILKTLLTSRGYGLSSLFVFTEKLLTFASTTAGEIFAFTLFAFGGLKTLIAWLYSAFSSKPKFSETNAFSSFALLKTYASIIFSEETWSNAEKYISLFST